MKLRLNIALLFFFAAATICATESGKQITIRSGEIHKKSITAFGGTLIIDGKIEESVLLIGGRMIVSGTVEKDVMALNSSVKINEGAIINGDLLVIGGELERSENSLLQGELFYLRTGEDLKKIISGILPFVSEGPGFSLMIRSAKALLWLIITLLVLVLLPRQVEQAAQLMRQSTMRTAATGLMTLLIIVFLTLISLVLSLFLIGIPLLLILLGCYLGLLAFGRAALFYTIGNSFCRAVRLRANSAIFVLLGLVFYFALRFIPFIGFIAVLALDFLVLGAGVILAGRRFFTKSPSPG